MYSSRPVTNDASSLARYATPAATSSGRPRRPIGVSWVITSQNGVFRAESRIGVSMNPGWIELTRMPSVAQCSAAFLVRVRTAPFAAWYAGDVPKPPLVPKIELMLITDAWPDAFRYGAAVRIP